MKIDRKVLVSGGIVAAIGLCLGALIRHVEKSSLQRGNLGFAETWGDNWKAETIHSPGMAWGEFENLHDFHERVAKP